MTLALVVDTLADLLAGSLPGVTVGDIAAGSAADLPAVAISVEDAAQQLVGVGGIPRGPRTGSLEVTDVVDLVAPVLDFGDETVELVSGDRLTALLAHGPVVDQESTVVADDDGPYALVDADPVGRQVRIDSGAGQVLFGQPLPVAGTLSLTYRIGMWDVSTVRFSGDVTLQTWGADAPAATNLTRGVAAALSPSQPPFTRLSPLTWGAATVLDVGTDQAHTQVLRYRFEFELEQVTLPTGGGVIDTVAVTSAADEAIEVFEVIGEGNAV